jgi:GrpB-like predicted nucleotidyltransferase (UPF0157 family)
MSFIKKEIKVYPYNPHWPIQFEIEAKKIHDLLKDDCLAIHHIGSTSVPGLSAKEHLDILLVIKDLREVKCLEQIGYRLKGEYNVPLRSFCSKNTSESKVNLHVCEKDHGFIPLQITFRDYLRTHPEVKDAYNALKYEILKSDDAGYKENSVFSIYNRRKNAFIKKTLRDAGFNELVVNFCCHDQEYKEAEKLTGHLIDHDISNIHHKHFILYKGVDIIGYAHVHDLKIKEIICLEHEVYLREVINKWINLSGI